jgi:hypothetical protein
MIDCLVGCLVWVGYFSGTGTLDAFLASALLVISVGLSLVVGVVASYLLMRVVLGAFGSRASMPSVERARAAAAGD